MGNTSSPAFVRDRLTWLAYGMLGFYGYYMASFGPIVPFLRAEFHLNYTVSGFHLSAYALGVVLTGVFGERVTRRLGRRQTFWGGAAGMVVGTLGLIGGWSVLVTLPSMFVMGLSGGLLLITIQAMLADRHGAQRTIALSEANVVASLSGSMGPLALGAAQRLGIGWRSALALMVVVLIAAFWAGRRVVIPDAADIAGMSGPTANLSRTFWLFALIIFVCVAIEWCVLFWAAEFLVQVIGLSTTAAAIAVSLFLGAMLVGRLVGSIIARAMPATRLLALALGLVAIGFPILWLAHGDVINVIGLCLTGIGVANLYPVSLALAMNAAPHQANVASARLTLCSSLATLTLPFGLGWLADQIGIARAFGVVPGLLGCALVLLIVAQRVPPLGEAAAC